MRISVTDRCNLRCSYCMPEDVPSVPHEEILRYEEILRICEAAVSLGICRFKITGGELFVRRGAADFLRALKEMPGTAQVTLTTNGQLLELYLDELQKMPVDGINISLDALHEPIFEKITGSPGALKALSAVQKSAASGILTKINTVLLEENADEWLPLLALAEEMPVAVRFIERMPVSEARAPIVPASVLLAKASAVYQDLHPVEEKLGNGPAVYYKSSRLQGHLGIIAANSSPFCSGCNRLRLTSTGKIQSCLGHPETTDLREAVRAGADTRTLAGLLAQAAAAKPAAHDFLHSTHGSPVRYMNEIGG